MKQGVIESRSWPETVKARVVAPGPQPTIHGYALGSDLAKHYRFADIVLLALTGELDPFASEAFDVAMRFACATSVADAPTHAATLAKLCGSQGAGIVSVAATGLAEQSRSMLERFESILPNLAIGSLEDLAAANSARDDTERAMVVALREALGTFCQRVAALAYDLNIEAAIIAVLVGCGLRHREQLELAFTFARLPIACAEAFAAKTGAFDEYAMNTPQFVYTGVSA